MRYSVNYFLLLILIIYKIVGIRKPNIRRYFVFFFHEPIPLNATTFAWNINAALWLSNYFKFLHRMSFYGPTTKSLRQSLTRFTFCSNAPQCNISLLQHYNLNFKKGIHWCLMTSQYQWDNLDGTSNAIFNVKLKLNFNG